MHDQTHDQVNDQTHDQTHDQMRDHAHVGLKADHGKTLSGINHATTGSPNLPASVLPPQTIGFLGGGQLGRMMAIAARRMGYRIAVLDPTPNSPCGQVADIEIVAPFTDVEAAKELARVSDVITYEFENVDADVAVVLESAGKVPQGSALLRTTQHRVREKQAIERAGAAVAPFRPITSKQSLLDAVSELGVPCVLKTCTGGYDGKGQWLLKSQEDAVKAWKDWASANPEAANQAANQQATVPSHDAPLILEGFVNFTKELSVIVARGQDGETRSFPPAENIHVHHILHLSIVPARVPESIQEEACRLAERIATSLNVVGLVAVEMFYCEDGRLFINELAPRPHNSGHYTFDACVTSQFEQQIRAVCGLPLGNPGLLTPAVMVNLLGQHVDPLIARFGDLPDGAKLHLYGKAEAKRDRKMGHVTFLGDRDGAIDWIESSGIWNDEA